MDLSSLKGLHPFKSLFHYYLQESIQKRSYKWTWTVVILDMTFLTFTPKLAHTFPPHSKMFVSLFKSRSSMIITAVKRKKRQIHKVKAIRVKQKELVHYLILVLVQTLSKWY